MRTMTTPITTAQDLINALIEVKQQKEELEQKEAFLKEQLQGAIAFGELKDYQQEDGIFQFPNAKYIRCERNSYKYSKDAERAMRTIKEQDIDAGLATRNVTTYYQLRTMD